jgi:hypothetical protein
MGKVGTDEDRREISVYVPFMMTVQALHQKGIREGPFRQWSGT